MPEEITVNVNVKPLQRLGELLEIEVEKALQTLSEETVKDAQQRAPVRTGFLRDNISGQVTGPNLVVTSAAPYSIFVEAGTRRMAARPFLTPAVEQAKVKLPELLQEAFRQAGAKAG